MLKGGLVIEQEDQKATLGPGGFHVMRRGTLQNPVAEEGCWLVLIESATTKHTGDVIMEKTKSIKAELQRKVRPDDVGGAA